MFTEVGHYALALALAVAFAQSLLASLPFSPQKIYNASHSYSPLYSDLIRTLSFLCFFCVTFAFIALSIAFATSDFSVALVAQHSHGAKPLIYKISGLWANHEGSMLLWVLVLSAFGAGAAYWASRYLPLAFVSAALGIQGLLVVAFILFILLTSNPFSRLTPPLLEGMDLNPLLEDPGLALHPPLLYMGYVGFSVVFSFACAALLIPQTLTLQKECRAWVRVVRRLTLISWIGLTLGILMGSYWAYYELGWGGWWFWDPVENASFMPWLSGTALLHSLNVVEKRNTLKIWTIFLSLLTFSLSLIGTFLVRSGIVTSVHAFASDPGRGLFILAILCFFIGGSLLLFGLRIPTLRQEGRISNPFSREGLLVFNNIFLTSACATVFIGTFYPLMLELVTGQKISVGPPFFEKTCVPIMAALFLLLPIGQSISWKNGRLPTHGLTSLLSSALLAFLIALMWNERQDHWATHTWIGLFLGLFLIVSVIQFWKQRLTPQTAQTFYSRLRTLSLSFWGMTIAHAGVGLFIIGVTASLWRTESLVQLKPLDFASLGAYSIRLDEISSRQESTYQSEVAHFTVFYHGQRVAETEASKRFYLIQDVSTVETGLVTFGLSQLYIAPGNFQGSSVDLRIYWHPFILLIWMGGIAMAFGGLLSLMDWRLKKKNPKPAGMIALAFFSLLPFSMPAFAESKRDDLSPSPCILLDPVLESRARTLSGQLRCIVCQNQSLDDSDAALAKDLRCLIRERLKAGDDEHAVKTFLTARYSEFILLEPIFGFHTFLLWIGPFFLLSIGIGIFLRHTMRMRNAMASNEEMRT
jgi:cytochrome c-type biogenesis protein CcmF